MTTSLNPGATTYHRSKIWQIGLFTLNNSATNIYLFTLGFLSYYAAGIVGLAVMVVSVLLGAIRVFDGLIDPYIGAFIDRLETIFGKYRPLMIAGNLILALSYLMIYSTHLLPEWLRVVFLIIALLVHKVGYSLQNSVTKAGQTVLTNDPKQRPLFTLFDTLYNFGVFSGGLIFVSTYLVGKHGGFTMDLFVELVAYAVTVSFALTLLAVFGIAPKDRKEYYGLGEDTVVTSGFRDYWGVIRRNRPLLLLTASAAADKIASQTRNQAVVLVMLFGIVIGDYSMSGTVAGLGIIPTIIVTVALTALATRKGLKTAYVSAVWLAILCYGCLVFLLLSMDDPSTISFSNLGLATIAFIVLFAFGNTFVGVPTTFVIPMIADVSDYETSKSGRYVAGMMGNVFSMIDQLVSSLAPVIVGVVVAAIGFSDQFPDIDDQLTVPLFYATIGLAFVIPILFLIVSLVCMKFYSLDGQTMERVQADIAAKKQAGKVEASLVPQVNVTG